MNKWPLCLLLVPCLCLGQSAGQAVQFDGSNDLVTIPHPEGLSFDANATATFEMWLRPTSDVNAWHALGLRDSCGSTMNYQIARDVSHLLHFNTTGCVFSSGTLIPINEWSHVAVTADGTTIRFYINGSFNNDITCGLGTTGQVSVTIGASSSCPATFPGLIDEVRIWNTVRSETQLADNYRCTILNPPADLIGYWQFNEETDAQQVLDSSDSGFDGSLGANLDPGVDDPVRVASTVPLNCFVFQDGFED